MLYTPPLGSETRVDDRCEPDAETCMRRSCRHPGGADDPTICPTRTEARLHRRSCRHTNRTDRGSGRALMSSARKTWMLQARQALLLLVLVTGASRLQSLPTAQSNSLTVLFGPSAGTFVGSETVTLSVQARADIHYTLDGS